MILFNIFIGEGEGGQQFSQDVQLNVGTLKFHHPELPYEFFDRDKIRDFLLDEYGVEILSYFDRLKPFTYQSDFARYCIAYKRGGIYADLSIYFVDRLVTDPTKMFVFSDLGWASPWDACTGVFFAPPGHKALAHAIEIVCANIRTRYYGPSALCPTGPAVLGKALALSCEADELNTGHSAPVEVAAWGSGFWHGYASRDNKLIAVKRKRSLSVAELGIKNGNHYTNLWNERDIYR